MRLTSEEVGQRIRHARLARGWTHDELARRMDANWRTVQRWQKGQLPRLPTLLRLADVLGVPRSTFVEPEDSLSAIESLRARVDELVAQVEELSGRVESLTRAVQPDEPAVRPVAHAPVSHLPVRERAFSERS